MSINQNSFPTREPLYTMADALISFSRTYADLSIKQIRSKSQLPKNVDAQKNQNNADNN